MIRYEPPEIMAEEEPQATHDMTSQSCMRHPVSQRAYFGEPSTSLDDGDNVDAEEERRALRCSRLAHRCAAG